jgi:hypothetical protein
MFITRIVEKPRMNRAERGGADSTGRHEDIRTEPRGQRGAGFHFNEDFEHLGVGAFGGIAGGDLRFCERRPRLSETRFLAPGALITSPEASRRPQVYATAEASQDREWLDECPGRRAAIGVLAQGVHPRLIMEILGHSQISITMNLYAHVIPAMQKKVPRKWMRSLLIQFRLLPTSLPKLIPELLTES